MEWAQAWSGKQICTRVVAPSQIEKSRGSCYMMLVRLCEIFLKDGKFSCFWVCMGGSVLSLPCTLAPRCTRRIRLAVKPIMLGLSLVASWGDHVELSECSLSTSAIQAGGSGQGGRKVNQSQPCLGGLTSPTLSSFFSRFFFPFSFLPSGCDSL